MPPILKYLKVPTPSFIPKCSKDNSYGTGGLPPSPRYLKVPTILFPRYTGILVHPSPRCLKVLIICTTPRYLNIQVPPILGFLKDKTPFYLFKSKSSKDTSWYKHLAKYAPISLYHPLVNGWQASIPRCICICICICIRICICICNHHPLLNGCHASIPRCGI